MFLVGKQLESLAKVIKHAAVDSMVDWELIQGEGITIYIQWFLSLCYYAEKTALVSPTDSCN